MTALPCDELGRVTRIYASGYDRSRVHDGRMVRGESRCLVVDFNGAIPAGRTVASVTWRCNIPTAIVMSNARIQAGARSVAVDVLAGWSCDTAIKCESTLDNGEVYAQLIRLAVQDAPWFQGETTPTTGPTTLTSP